MKIKILILFLLIPLIFHGQQTDIKNLLNEQIETERMFETSANSLEKNDKNFDKNKGNMLTDYSKIIEIQNKINEKYASKEKELIKLKEEYNNQSSTNKDEYNETISSKNFYIYCLSFLSFTFLIFSISAYIIIIKNNKKTALLKINESTNLLKIEKEKINMEEKIKSQTIKIDTLEGEISELKKREGKLIEENEFQERHLEENYHSAKKINEEKAQIEKELQKLKNDITIRDKKVSYLEIQIEEKDLELKKINEENNNFKIKINGIEQKSIKNNYNSHGKFLSNQIVQEEEIKNSNNKKVFNNFDLNINKLEKFYHLKENGIISEEEYLSQKGKILSEI
ncbi:MAG: hypothetical protein Q8880_10150 [Bacteroidota bacterium]|nr:hypothetical protein [Bacteroidota bacterium]